MIYNYKMSVSDQHKVLIEKYLRQVPVFKNLTEDHVIKFVNSCSVRKIKKNSDIVFQSEDSTDLYLVLKGSVKVNLMSYEGEEFILTSFNEGDFFGEMSLIDGSPRSAAVVAQEDTLLGVLRRENILQAVREKPEIALDFLTTIVKRLRKADAMIEALAFLDVRERLIKFLAQQAKADEERNDDGFYRIKKLTHKELASRIGSSREAVSKILKVLSMKNIVREEKGNFLLSPSIYEDEEIF